MSGVNEIRSAFLDYFKREGHEIVPSSSLVPRNDPTLMFTNAGMVQFKNVFTGLEHRDPPRAVTSQKCVRAGGKHNDLDNVGYTARHHTFFEMLGNFSFGDYFKDRAIELAWNLVTKEFGLPADRLLATVYSEDDEAFDLWKKIAGLPEDRIIRIPTSDNFWQMGDTGPCGPCSEIFFDHGEGIPGGPPGSPDEDGDRFIEIWNLVFMQFDQQPGGERLALPKPSIDTGMGLERIAAVLQGVHDNYEIDLFGALIAASEEVTGVAAEGASHVSHKVIADHLRASSFLLADGVMPSNEGRGYVLRRIMRRAMRHAHLLGAREPVLCRLVPALVREMGRAYPELGRAEDLITETLELEEDRFRRTLDRGNSLLEEEERAVTENTRSRIENLQPDEVDYYASRAFEVNKDNKNIVFLSTIPEKKEALLKLPEKQANTVMEAALSGEIAFKLYDTYGFPLDLTQDALRARGITVEIQNFEQAMERQRAEARKGWKGSGEAAVETVWFAVKDRVGATDFLGYETDTAEGVVTALVADGKEIDRLEAGQEGVVILNQTPFYGEAGGQVGDTGEMSAPGVRFVVTDTQKKADGLSLHFGRVEEGVLTPDTALNLKIDAERRSQIRANHSATHLVHEALRQVLGTHVAQKGSLVAPDRLRFDFSHNKPMSAEEIEAVEEVANRIVLQNDPVTTRLMALEDAIEAGAMALFGEKYADEVRVVAMGHERDGNGRERVYSMELCGGTHVRRTGDIGLVSVVSESAVSAGVRRIEAFTAGQARRYLQGQDKRVREVANVLKVAVGDVVDRSATLVEERRRLERELADTRKKLALAGPAGSGGGEADVKKVGDVSFMGRTVEGIGGKDLKGLVDDAKKKLGSGVVAIIGKADDGKAGIVVGVTADLTDRYDAVSLVRAGSEALGGKGGGGRPDLAQAGGPNAGDADKALAAVEAALAGGA
ncbi:alanine--tRNA ligase [Amorphus orientalis]|uniref:Alanine--tRNA ligase n=1 Tax=Amorphus orientalis TaxID=649198 RepID=A0AAE4AUU0_9HYPH|nr:alanine--tRNA ligase [Amorphus orientalis]MDQ0317517.1 alanyl-tRNA synthetase [Amorphus orientalis]